jgi:type III secretion protein T
MTSGLPLPGVLALGLSLTRTACAYLMLPVFGNQVGPALVRNSFFVGTGLMILALQPPVAFESGSALHWTALYLHEIVLGLLIGFFFAGVLWALQIAGDTIDQKINAARFMQTNPFSGAGDSVFGDLFGRVALYVFAASGGFIYVTNVLLESYVIWPIDGALRLKMGSLDVFDATFAQLVVLSLMLSAPALVLMTLFDGFSGLVNKIVPNFNVFSASFALKAWFGVFAVSISIGVVVTVFAQNLVERSAKLLSYLHAVIS